jgi:hypothetical protein
MRRPGRCATPMQPGSAGWSSGASSTAHQQRLSTGGRCSTPTWSALTSSTSWLGLKQR